MHSVKADQQRNLVQKRPPLPTRLKEEMVMACQQIQLLDTNRLLSAYRSSKALSAKGKIDAASVFIKRIPISRSTARHINTSVDSTKTSVQHDSSQDLRESKQLGELQKMLDGKENTSTNDDKSSRVSTSYSERGLKVKRIISKATDSTQYLFRTENFLREKLTSKSWIVYDETTKTVLFEKGSTAKRQMASLTKIMTCLLTLQVMDELSLDINRLRVLVSKKAASTIGTTAELVPGS